MAQTKVQVQQRVFEIQANMYQLQQDELALRNMWQAVQNLENEQKQSIQTEIDGGLVDAAVVTPSYVITKSPFRGQVQTNLIEIQAKLYQLKQEEVGLQNMWQAIEMSEKEAQQETEQKANEDSKSESIESEPTDDVTTDGYQPTLAPESVN